MFLPSLSPDPPPHHPLLLFAPALSQKLESAKNIYEALPLHPAPNPREKTTTTARMSKTNKNLNDVSRTITHTCLMLAKLLSVVRLSVCPPSVDRPLTHTPTHRHGHTSTHSAHAPRSACVCRRSQDLFLMYCNSKNLGRGT